MDDVNERISAIMIRFLKKFCRFRLFKNNLNYVCIKNENVKNKYKVKRMSIKSKKVKINKKKVKKKVGGFMILIK